MNNLEKYLDQVIEQRPAAYEMAPPSSEAPKPSVAQGVLRRWYIALFVTIALCGLGLPAIWLLIEPQYVVMGAMNVALPGKDPLTGKPDAGAASAYRESANTHATMILSQSIVGDVADDLKDRNIAFFSSAPRTRLDKIKAMLISRGTSDHVKMLRDAIMSGVITAAPLPQTTLVAVTMKDQDQSEAIDIVNSFLNMYKRYYDNLSSDVEKADRGDLEGKQKVLLGKIKEDNAAIMKIATDGNYATTDLAALYESEWNLQNKLETQRMDLEAKKSALGENTPEVPMSPTDRMAATREYVNSDPRVKELSTNIVQMERDLIIARKSYSAENPELKRKEGLVADFKTSLEERTKELEAKFDEMLDKRREDAAKQKLAEAQAQLEQVKLQLNQVVDALTKQKERTTNVGRANLQIRQKEFELSLDKDMYDQVTRRLSTLTLVPQAQEQARISVWRKAEVDGIEDKRIKYSAALVFMALGCGCGLALLRDKMDKTLQDPEDVSRHIGLPLLGTTTSSRTVRPEQFPEQIASDYQTIRANLGLTTAGGMPRRIAISSARTREGKTTFAVNLATSLAKAGKNVLLIDGDLRKPDVRYMLNLQDGTAGVQEVLLGEDPGRFVRTVPASGLHVLTASSRSPADVYELLTSPTAAEQIEKLSREYDHIIIDTPPALAFPDALVWAKLADAVILVGFAGQTTSTELKEAKERFLRVRARILGAILSNVPAEQGLYRYGYSYSERASPAMRRDRKRRKLLLPVRSSSGKTSGDGDRNRQGEPGPL